MTQRTVLAALFGTGLLLVAGGGFLLGYATGHTVPSMIGGTMMLAGGAVSFVSGCQLCEPLIKWFENLPPR